MQIKKIILILLSCVLILTGCNLPFHLDTTPQAFATTINEWKWTVTPSQETSAQSQFNSTAQPTIQATEVSNPTTPTATIIEPTPVQETQVVMSSPAVQGPKIYLHPGLSPGLLSQMQINSEQITNDEGTADVIIKIHPSGTGQTDEITWVYALVSPFYTIPDEISLTDLSSFWKGGETSNSYFKQILLTAETKSAVELLLGEASDSTVSIISAEDLASRAASNEAFLSILPFEAVSPQWKILRIDQQSPIDTNFDPSTYPLTLYIGCEGTLAGENCQLPGSNYNSELRTVVVMTGVTALTRATAYRMAIMGNTYPGKDIQSWLSSADITHISNEIPFAENCPDPDPIAPSLIFCSSPDRIELLESIGADIIELSGNHMLDYGLDAIQLTLKMYENRNWSYFAGGWDLADAQSPALITHHGNKLAFIGCNNVGPYGAFAGDGKPGATPCAGLDWMVEKIQVLRAEGYLPIATFQYAEDYTAYPTTQMVRDFERLADAGAIVVNGSQAHTPKLMTFYKDSFLHFGLGNLFFDQMQMTETRQEFIDRLVFYNGKLVSVELLTAMLEEYARPRPMTLQERSTFLSRIFSAATNFNE